MRIRRAFEYDFAAGIGNNHVHRWNTSISRGDDDEKKRKQSIFNPIKESFAYGQSVLNEKNSV
jgi:hypothetical protein